MTSGKSFKKKVAVALLGVVFALILLEVGLRLAGSGVQGIQERRNEAALALKDVHRVVCFGESTTAMGSRTGMGGADAYPSQLQEILNRRLGKKAFAVINKGISGADTSLILKRLEETLDRYRPVLVVAMMGANDSAGAIPDDNVPVAQRTGFPYSIKTYKLIRQLAHLGFGRRSAAEEDAADDDYSLSESEDDEDGMRRAGELENQRDFKGAELIYLKEIAREPGHQPARHKLVQLYKRQGEHEKITRLLSTAIKQYPHNGTFLSMLARYYFDRGEHQRARQLFARAEDLRMRSYSPMTRYNYHKMKEVLDKRGIKFVAVQYPGRNVRALKKLFPPATSMVFVDNQKPFKGALAQGRYDEYFWDNIYGDFGHITKKGHRIIAENIADAILKISSW